MASNKLKKNNRMYSIYRYGDKSHRRIQCGYGHSEYRPAGCKVPKYVHLMRTMDCNDSPKWCYPLYILGWVVVALLVAWSIYTGNCHLSDYWWHGLVGSGLCIVLISLLWNVSPSTPGRKMYIVRIFDKRDIPKLKKRFVIRWRMGCSVIMWDKKR